MKVKNLKILIISILIPIIVGLLSYFFTEESMTQYNYFTKPSISPPTIIFPIVWTILYVLMGISSYRIYISKKTGSGSALLLYALQLIFNFFWSIIFFNYSNYLFAFIWLIIMIILIICMIFKFYKIDKFSAYLQIFYLLWSLFAAYLNFSVYLLN